MIAAADLDAALDDGRAAGEGVNRRLSPVIVGGERKARPSDEGGRRDSASAERPEVTSGPFHSFAPYGVFCPRRGAVYSFRVIR
jgi:hypothetical protein